jgi:hypothetical protein
MAFPLCLKANEVLGLFSSGELHLIQETRHIFQVFAKDAMKYFSSKIKFLTHPMKRDMRS